MTTTTTNADRFDALLDGAMSDAEASHFLANHDPDGASLAEAVRAVRARMIAIDAPPHAIDVCGTGGDGQHTLNVSTAVAIVVAACGVPVAKHGNRAASSLAGGADTLEALGLDLAKASARAEETLADMGLAFLFAQAHHPALARLGPLRKALGKRTILNLTGPLCNPAQVRRQLIGVANMTGFAIFSAVPWADLGMERVLVVCGAEGLDELSIAGPSHVFAYGMVAPAIITPEDAGLPRHPLDALKGGDAAFNARELRKMLRGDPDQNPAYRDAVLLNSAAALMVAGEAHNLRDAVEELAEVIDRGLAIALLDCWIAAVH
ncbi:anthranilate phosphoribosyltransferase [Novosphingobium sp.]|uniref:anthranilate phosphoribosyltransferase n=1 Tax=Novosphingobium sp. TaxID=1874826 RepID=UPI0025E8C418|nr:anthranilate phosphoribosyltransferase [Novosphingobium sp.]